MNKDKEVESYLKGELPEEEKLKYEIAGELGLLDQVLENGWKSLSAKETGRIGGLMTRRKKARKIRKQKSSCSQVITGNAVNRSSKEDSWEEGVLFFIVSKSVL